MTSTRQIRDRARLAAQGHADQLRALIDEAALEAEMKDAMRKRLRDMWNEATVAMTAVEGLPPKQEPGE
jgi:hypothetical protein